tara:strand:+ start:34716 stop:35276 length:561 start_codon:yes stop_codon:yes gene_type:complete
MIKKYNYFLVIMIFIFPNIYSQSSVLSEKKETFAWLQYAIDSFSSDYVLGETRVSSTLEMVDYNMCSCIYTAKQNSSGNIAGESYTYTSTNKFEFEFGDISKFEKFNSLNPKTDGFEAVKIRFLGDEVKNYVVSTINDRKPTEEIKRIDFANFYIKLEIQDRFLKALRHMNLICKNKIRKVNKNKF